MFEDQPRSIQCRSCQPKYESGFIPNEQRTACEKPAWTTVADCKEGYYLNDTKPTKERLSTDCNRCPPGSSCQEQLPKKLKLSELQPQKSEWWRVPETWSPPHTPLFVKCPYRNRCYSNGCLNTSFSEGPLCAVCSNSSGSTDGKDYFRSSSGICEQCTDTTVRLKLLTLSSIMTICLLFVWTQRKRIQRLRAKYGAAWRDIVRILTINLSYCQVSSSLPSMIQIPWPKRYLEMLDTFAFVNIDIVSLLGFKCVGGGFFDFRGRLVLATCVPPIVVLICFIVYECRRGHVKKRAKHGTSSMKEMTMHSVEYLWDMFDLDESGELDEEEFHNLLINLKASPEHIHPDNKEMRLEIMHDLKAQKRHDTRHRHKYKYIVIRPHFVELVASGKLGNAMRDDWILWAERQRIREHFLSDMLLVLFLLHAPLSQRGFYFFACTPVGNKYFLLADYTIECYQDKHQVFVPLAIGFLVLFSFLFPLLVLLQLCRHRKRLHTPEIRHRFGFLYRSFNIGGEYWEIHEVFRKMILTGLLVFIPGNSRPAVAILVSVMTVASLNYVRPHKNYLVFWVAQASFLLTTFKYLAVILLANRNENEGTNTNDVVGTLLIILDITFMVVSFFTLFGVLLLLRSVLSKDSKKELMNGTKVTPDSGSVGELLPASRWNSFDHVKALANAKVDKTEEETQKAHDAAMKVVEEKQHVAHDRLQMRLRKRTTMLTSVMTSVVPVVPVETKEDDDKAMQTKKELNFFKNEKEGKKETRNVSNPGEI